LKLYCPKTNPKEQTPKNTPKNPKKRQKTPKTNSKNPPKKPKNRKQNKNNIKNNILVLIMPLYFKELEKVFIKWYKLFKMPKPRDSAASWITYKSMQRSAKKLLIKEMIIIFNNIENSDITVEDNVYIIHSRL
tara:strand:- start:124 stop:522 length:399 start_codon:yes stop_codon:yes gene_type:complete